MKAHQLSRRTFYLAAIVAIIASTSGFALASVLSPPTVASQGANFYDATSNNLAGYDSAALTVAQSPGACSSGTVVDSTNGGVAVLVISAYTGATNCTKYDFAEQFTLGYVTSSVLVQNDNFTVYSQIGGGAVMSNSAHLEIGSASDASFTATVEVFVDYGAMAPPSGITSLELVVHNG